jgi:LAO/AO transport system kinase
VTDAELVERARRLEKYPIARLISLFEEETDKARARRVEVLRVLGAGRRALVVGVTGTPGSGKSTLIGRLALELFARDADLAVAVLAIDPSSEASGGALLGDRVRTDFPVGEQRLYFRSQAAAGDLGGVGRRTFAATRVLSRLFDLILVETVGIGQSEIEIRRLADRVLLVLQPLAGDHVQFLKAGVMEIPDAYVINKCDEEQLARRALGELRSALRSNGLGGGGGKAAEILRTSATTGRGVRELADWVLHERATGAAPGAAHARDVFYLRKEVAREYGAFGISELERAEKDGSLAALVRDEAWFEAAESSVLTRLRARLK